MVKLGPFTFNWQVIDGLLHLYVTAPFTKVRFYQSRTAPVWGKLLGHYNVPVSQAPYVVCSVQFSYVIGRVEVTAYIADTTTAMRAGLLPVKSPDCA